jgi:hypothetical protein
MIFVRILRRLNRICQITDFKIDKYASIASAVDVLLCKRAGLLQGQRMLFFKGWWLDGSGEPAQSGA